MLIDESKLTPAITNKQFKRLKKGLPKGMAVGFPKLPITNADIKDAIACAKAHRQRARKRFPKKFKNLSYRR